MAVTVQMNEFDGMRRELEIGLRIAPTRASAPAAAKAIACYLDAEPVVPVRLVELAQEGSRIHITLAVTLGAIDAIKVADPSARAAVGLIQRIVDDLAAYDPAFVTLPAASVGPMAKVVGRPVPALRGAVEMSPVSPLLSSVG
jgi:hypothetical protein